MKKSEFNEIELIVYDFDGVMTDNTALVDEFGHESVFVNRSDGLAISELKKRGYEQIIISTETNNVVKKRADKLKLFCLNDVENKLKALLDYIERKGINKEKVIYVGNDINDLEVMLYVGIPVAPNDAYPQIKNIAKIITKAKGGKGVIRELFDTINE